MFWWESVLAAGKIERGRQAGRQQQEKAGSGGVLYAGMCVGNYSVNKAHNVFKIKRHEVGEIDREVEVGRVGKSMLGGSR